MEMFNYNKEMAAAIAEAEALEAAVDLNGEKHTCKLNLDPIPLQATQRTKQYVTDQAKVWETEFQLCDDGVPAKTEPSPSHSISPSHLKPEAKPFFPDQTNTASQSPHLIAQQPCTYEDEYVHEPHEVRFKNDQATPVQHFRPQNDNDRHTPLPYPMSSNSNNGSSNINDFVSLWLQAYLTNLKTTEPGNILFKLQPMV